MDDPILSALRLQRTTLGLQEHQLHQLAEAAELLQIAEGTVLHVHGQPVDALLLVAEGRLNLGICDERGREFVIRRLGRGAQFGLLGITGDAPLPVQLTADTESQVLRISREDALQLLRDIPLWRRQLEDSMGGWRPNALQESRKRLQSVAFLHASPRAISTTKALVRRLCELGERVAVFTDRSDALQGLPAKVESMVDEVGGVTDLVGILNRVSRHRDMDRVVMSFDTDRVERYLKELCQVCDLVYWFAEPQDAETAARQLKSLTDENPTMIDRMRWVWRLEEQPVAPLISAVAPIVGREFKLLNLKSDVDGRLYERGIIQILHELRSVKLGIALSGGAARCMAHLGVLQAIEQAGIVVDAISGTSGGAMVGVLYSSGMHPTKAAECFARELNPRFESRLPRGDVLYLLRKYRRGEWDGMLRKYLYQWQLQQLQTPISTVSVDLVSGRQQILSSGDAVTAILESINIPGLSPPILRDGMALVDGGVLNNLPADVLVSQRADFVVAVDVGAQLPKEFAAAEAGGALENPRPPNAFVTVQRAMNVRNDRMNALGADPADFRIEPDVSDFALTDFRSSVEIAHAGREAAEQVLSDLRDALLEVDPSLVVRT